MKTLEKLNIDVMEINKGMVVIPKQSFTKLINSINILTDTVNNLIEHQQVTEDSIKAIAKVIEQ